jgi:excisionase family DNA binding protein
MDEPRVTLTVGEAAKLLRLSRAFTYELVARGELPSIRLGRRIVIPRIAIERILSDSVGAPAGLRPRLGARSAHGAESARPPGAPWTTWPRYSAAFRSADGRERA